MYGVAVADATAYGPVSLEFLIVSFLVHEEENVGSKFEDFLAEDGLWEDVQAAAIKAVFAEEMRHAMTQSGISEIELARRMGITGRGTVRRLLDPKNGSATPISMVKAAVCYLFVK